MIHRALRRAAANAFLPADRVFNRIFTASWNPLYRSGTLAVVFLLAATVSGIYLLFFFKLGDPYASALRLQDQPWAGRWIRAFHRHASSAAMVCALIHAVRMFAQGKSWGRRALAWTSGVFLVLLLAITAWTGYLMVWDQSAQAINTALVGMVDRLKISASPLAQSFSGDPARPLPSFFFMVLFMHVVLPLALVFVIWLHTSRLARARWFPSRRQSWTVIGLLLIVALLRPAPLAPPADLLGLPREFFLDPWSTAWVPFALNHPGRVAALGAGVFLVIFSLPFWLRPTRSRRPAPSDLDPMACVGCGRCAHDCPYEAISMIPRTDNPGGARSTRLALVSPDRCVSCGLCAASCLTFTIGPPGRKGSDQLGELDAFLADRIGREKRHPVRGVVVGCRNQTGSLARLQAFTKTHPEWMCYPVSCGGTLHPSVLERLAAEFSRVVLAACPPRNCTNKDGFLVLSDRLAGKRAPPHFVNPALRDRIEILPSGDGEERHLLLKLQEKPGRSSAPRVAAASRILLGLALLLLVVIPVPVRQDPSQARLRLSWRLTGQRIEHTRVRPPEELAKLPVHMRTVEERVTEPVPFQLIVRIDERTVIDKTARASGLRQDGPLYVFEEIPLDPGSRQVSVRFEPRHIAAQNLRALEFHAELHVLPGRVVLIGTHPGDGRLVAREGL